MKIIPTLLLMAGILTSAHSQPAPFGGSTNWNPTPEEIVNASSDRHKAFAEAPLVRAPKTEKTKGPVYPFGAARSKVGGVVRVLALIDEKGRAVKVQILESHPAGIFDAATKSALQKWLFGIEKQNSKPIKYVIDYVFTYTPN